MILLENKVEIRIYLLWIVYKMKNYLQSALI